MGFEWPIAMKKTNRRRRGFLIAFLVILGVIPYFTFNAARNFATTWNVTDLGDFQGLDFRNPTPTPFIPKEGTPVPGRDPQIPALQLGSFDQQPWDDPNRVTILIMGLDFRDWEAGQNAPRTDTMILLTVDPLSQTVGMLSIPRDLYVSIPGFEYGRINTAYRLGELYQMPEGGGGLAVQTVEQLLGVPIDYYGQIEFNAFVRMIDEIGGLKIDVKEPIEVDPIGPGNHKFLEPGRQTLPGDVALAYARARNTEGGDFDRAQRQQQVILSIRNRILSLDLIPILIARSGVLYRELSEGINTNISLEQAIQLGLLAKDIPEEQIKRGIIGTEHIIFFTTPEGAQVLRPLPDKIRQVRDEIFGTFDLSSPLSELSLEERAQAEDANILILNGTLSVAGLAGRTTEYLNAKGMDIPPENIGDSTQGYPATTIIDYTGNPYTIQFLTDTLNITDNNIWQRYDPASEVDVEVNLGNDWATNNDLP